MRLTKKTVAGVILLEHQGGDIAATFPDHGMYIMFTRGLHIGITIFDEDVGVVTHGSIDALCE